VRIEPISPSYYTLNAYAPSLNPYASYKSVPQITGVSGQPAMPALPAITGTAGFPGQDSAGPKTSLYSPLIIVDISPEGREASNRLRAGIIPGEAMPLKAAEVFKPNECQTCKNRKYQDVSSDGGVSFQSPTHISPGQAGGAVAAHEGEHVAREQAKAEQSGRKVVSQTVTLQSSICPECGRVYISGGVTRTITADKSDNTQKTPEEQNT